MSKFLFEAVGIDGKKVYWNEFGELCREDGELYGDHRRIYQYNVLPETIKKVYEYDDATCKVCKNMADHIIKEGADDKLYCLCCAYSTQCGENRANGIDFCKEGIIKHFARF